MRLVFIRTPISQYNNMETRVDALSTVCEGCTLHTTQRLIKNDFYIMCLSPVSKKMLFYV